MRAYRSYEFRFYDENGDSVTRWFLAEDGMRALAKASDWAYFNGFVDFKEIEQEGERNDY